MSLPETVPVRYTEEEAEYLSVRPVVRQTFRLQELIDMVLGVTGKDLARVQQILRSGTVVFHFFRYWWSGFDADPEELAALLARFPDADPSRAFRAEHCTAVVLESGGQPARQSLEIRRAVASRRRFLRPRTFWDFLMDFSRVQPPAYLDYSYRHRADLYERAISAEQLAVFYGAAKRLAPRELQAQLRHLSAATRIVFVCPR